MEAIKDGKATPSKSSKKITSDFIAAFADKAPYNVSPGFLQAGIKSMNPAAVCNALGVEAVGWRSHITFIGLRWFIKILTVAQRSAISFVRGDVLIKVKVREARESIRLTRL